MRISELIGDVLNEQISVKGLNYSTFANQAGVTQGYISKIINGEVKSIKLETLEKLVEPLNLSVVEFLNECEKKKTLLISPLLVMN